MTTLSLPGFSPGKYNNLDVSFVNSQLNLCPSSISTKSMSVFISLNKGFQFSISAVPHEMGNKNRMEVPHRCFQLLLLIRNLVRCEFWRSYSGNYLMTDTVS